MSAAEGGGSGGASASGRRLALIYRNDLTRTLNRPIFWVLIIVIGLTAFGLSSGTMQISSGNSAVGGTKAWITSEFANAKMFSFTVFLFYMFFMTILFGMSVMADEELKIGEILHATPLTPAEYIRGKFLGIFTAIVIAIGAHLLLTMFFNHAVPNAKALELRGPFGLMNYLRPMFVFGLPPLVFIAGTTFAIGERTRRPILVFVLPIAALILCGFFLWNWTPSWLDPRINRILMLIDPAGVRWIAETWIKVDRGVEFYNKHPMGFDYPFLASRLAFVLIGIASVAWSERRFGLSLRGGRVKVRAGDAAVGPDTPTGRAAGATVLDLPSITDLRMRSSAPGFVRAARDVLRFELREIKSQPGLYLFVPIILIQTLGTTLTAIGAMDTPVLVTAGAFATRSLGTLSVLVCLLSLFYTVESLRRERNTGIASIYYTTPARTASILAGKSLANSVVGVFVVLATMLGGVIAILIQRKVPIDIGPMLYVWGVALLPTFIAWTAFTTLVFSITVNRYTTYAVGLAALSLTGWLQMTGKMSWVGNWTLWGSLQWSDMGRLEYNQTALLLNRLLALSLAAFFTAAAVRFFPRHDRDATRTVLRLAPGAVARGALRLSPYALPAIALVIALWFSVEQGFQGHAEKKREKDYWRRNLATWKDAPTPSLAHVDLNLDLNPRGRSFAADGRFDLVNKTEKPLRQVPLTGGTHWRDLAWTMNGAEVKPDDRNFLYVFTPSAPLAPGESLHIGFKYSGTFPKGITKNGGGTMEFILPSAAVLTSFQPSFVPVIGFIEDAGVDKDNRYEPKVYPDDFYEGRTGPAFGAAQPFTTRIRITAPQAYTLNSVGTKTEDTVAAGKRTVVWKSDEPVRFFNVVAGRWNVKATDETAVFYYPKHKYNIDEMSAGLEAARRYYSEWFYPYPWKELKLSEFPAYAFYAQGFPTNITFSEGIGFLTKSDPKTNLAFMVTAHESAHQWWGNILTPGKGPGGNILSEGMANFSTILLMDQVKGERARIEFCKRIEEAYGDERQVDSEHPLVKIDDSRAGDETVTYDKGGWVFWMLLNRMGRDADFAGLREFIRTWKDGPDFPVLQDFTAAMRPFAPDTASYDDFVRQWFHEVVVPEYQLTDAKRAPGGAGSGAAAGGSAPAADSLWTATVHVKNIGAGRMPVEIAAEKGDRFAKDGTVVPDYRAARATVTLGVGEETDVAIACGFKPDRITVDPDAMVLQLRRKNAIARM
jgi:ABC-2 type transport system permease protein